MAPPVTADPEQLERIEALLGRLVRFIERVQELPMVRMWLRGLKI